MIFTTIEQIRAAKTNELIAFYNANVSDDKAVTKFRDRATAEARAASFLAALAPSLDAPEAVEPGWITTPEEVAAALPVATGWTRFPRGEDFGLTPLVLPKFVMPKSANSIGIAASWSDPEVKAARLTRHHVRVSHNGQVTEFKSVAEAFRAHKLPFEKHIKFRAKVKAAAGEPIFFEHKGLTYAFEAVAV